VKQESQAVKKCAVMFINPVRERTPHPSAMRARGFIVHEITEWPMDEAAMRDYHVVVVLVQNVLAAPMLAARLRAKPHADRRMLVALVPAGTAAADRRSAEASGFDDVLEDSCVSRHLTTRILRGIRARPELRCILPPSVPRRRAA
jgi:hypothetical protein